MKKSAVLVIGLLYFCAAQGTRAWIDYGDAPDPVAAVFGEEFAGFSLKLTTDEQEFEQESSAEIKLILKNTSGRSTLMPGGGSDDRRSRALYIIIANKDGTSLFSRNIVAACAGNMIEKGKIPPNISDLLTVSFDDIEVARVEEYEDGMPYFPQEKQMRRAGELPPQLLTLKAVLLSGLEGRRPDFALSSETRQVLLLPKSPERMTATEKDEKKRLYLGKLSRDAYGGMAVSSQLASFGEEVVPELIEIAERRGGGKVRESRIWAIVTLCNTGSETAENYILERLRDPVDFGDLSFLTWHSQGFGSQRITDALQELAGRITTNRELPWEEKHGRDSRIHGRGCLEFIFKHFITAKVTVPDPVVAGSLRMGDPQLASFAMQVWKPSSPDNAVKLLKQVFLTANLHPTLKARTLHTLHRQLADAGFPKGPGEGDSDLAWINAALWLSRHGRMNDEELEECLRKSVFSTRSPRARAEVVRQLRITVGESFPVHSPRPAFPEDWISTWRWALKQGTLTPEQAVGFLCAQMRTKEEIPAQTQRALLIELKTVLGSDFPLESTRDINLEEDWPECGNWLIQNGYFGETKDAR